jgi:glycolate oxidase
MAAMPTKLIEKATAATLAELAAALPDGTVITDPDVMQAYRRDQSSDLGAGMPAAVVRPSDAGEVATTMRWAHRHRVAVVPRGAGSGLAGGSSALTGGITLSLDRMRAIEVDTASRVAIVEPGALNAEVKAAAQAEGLWYPPDPASFEICSIGGNIATNAGGLCCVKYGVTADYVLGLDVVLADGSTVSLGGNRLKDVAGLSLLKVMLGSEGILGIVTRATLRLVPAQPAASTMVALFSSVEMAAEAVVAISRAARPSMLELMDAAAINAVEDLLLMGLDRSAGALLLAQSDLGGPGAAAEIAEIEQLCLAAGAKEAFSTTDLAEGEAFAVARRAAFNAIERRGSIMLEDVGVAVPLLPQLLRGVAAIAARNDIEIPVVAHAGDGNTHPFILFDPADPESVRRAEAAFDEIMTLAVSLHGTITGEHGVGRLKRAHLPAQLGPDVMALSRRVKDAFDPLGILNPGAVL